jgi:RimJ/RimL family protein N-acetyltransferase
MKLKLPIVHRKLTFRYASWNDCEIIWKWRNDETTRKNSFNSKFIGFEEHQEWFKKKLEDEKTKVIIIELDRRAIGVVRFDMNFDDDSAEISINLAPEERGKNYGTIAIMELSNFVLENYVAKVVAKIKYTNRASIKAFSNAGFKETFNDGNVVVMEKTR